MGAYITAGKGDSDTLMVLVHLNIFKCPAYNSNLLKKKIFHLLCIYTRIELNNLDAKCQLVLGSFLKMSMEGEKTWRNYLLINSCSSLAAPVCINTKIHTYWLNQHDFWRYFHWNYFGGSEWKGLTANLCHAFLICWQYHIAGCLLLSH